MEVDGYRVQVLDTLGFFRPRLQGVYACGDTRVVHRISTLLEVLAVGQRS